MATCTGAGTTTSGLTSSVDVPVDAARALAKRFGFVVTAVVPVAAAWALAITDGTTATVDVPKVWYRLSSRTVGLMTVTDVPVRATCPSSRHGRRR